MSGRGGKARAESAEVQRGRLVAPGMIGGLAQWVCFVAPPMVVAQVATGGLGKPIMWLGEPQAVWKAALLLGSCGAGLAGIIRWATRRRAERIVGELEAAAAKAARSKGRGSSR